MAKCDVCFRERVLKEGQTGACGARINRDGTVVAKFYGLASSLALDPIEKKPLAHFHPGSVILSVGSLGCNLQCPFCQNHEIAQRNTEGSYAVQTEMIEPERLVRIAERYKSKGNIGIAFTYNEPLVGYEYIKDVARQTHEQGLLNVLVTNGTVSLKVIDEIIPYIDAMNIDLKGFTDHYYQDVLKGNRQMTMDFIREAVKWCHVELTTLIVPGENDTDNEMWKMSSWIAGLNEVYGGKTGKDIPLHVSRFFPRYRMTDRRATDVKTVYRLADVAREKLLNVHTGNC